MRTGMARPDRRQSGPGELGSELLVAQDARQGRRHFCSVLRTEVTASRKQCLGVAPRRADERNAARERLEHADGGNAGKRLYIRASRYMYGRARACERLRHAMIGQPALVCDPMRGEIGPRSLRIAHPVDSCTNAKPRDRLDQEL